MLKIDTENMMICLTRGDTANIVFSAVDDSGTEYSAQIGDEIRFAVSKKVGATPLFEIINIGDPSNIYEEVSYEITEVDQATYEANPTNYWILSGGDYVQCTALDPYDPNEDYYIQNTEVNTVGFWTIAILTEHTNDLKFGDYAFDVQLSHTNAVTGEREVDTIIGVTDEINPIFRVWGEVANEG